MRENSTEAKSRGLGHSALISDRTFAIGVMWMQGYSVEDTKERLGVGTATVSRHRQRFDTYCQKVIPVEQYRKLFMGLMPLAYASLKHNLQKKHPTTTLAFLQGMHVLNNKVEPVQIVDDMPTTEQIEKVMEWLNTVPVLKQLALEKLGVAEPVASLPPASEETESGDRKLAPVQ